jgi:hypothetical protein
MAITAAQSLTAQAQHRRIRVTTDPGTNQTQGWAPIVSYRIVHPVSILDPRISLCERCPKNNTTIDPETSKEQQDAQERELNAPHSCGNDHGRRFLHV